MTIKTVDVKTLKDWIENGEAVIVDVREPSEYAAQKINGSILLPLGSISKSDLPKTVGKKLVIHCQLGRRGAKACEKLLKEDQNLEIYNLEGGLSAWSAAGYNVVTSKKFFLPLDQQVQLTIGLGVLIGSLLTHYVNPDFFLLTSLFGAGLTFAGITGFCGLAKVMSKMPWNQASSK